MSKSKCLGGLPFDGYVKLYKICYPYIFLFCSLATKLQNKALRFFFFLLRKSSPLSSTYWELKMDPYKCKFAAEVLVPCPIVGSLR